MKEIWALCLLKFAQAATIQSIHSPWQICQVADLFPRPLSVLVFLIPTGKLLIILQGIYKFPKSCPKTHLLLRMDSEILQLSKVIADSTRELVLTCRSEGIPIPSLRSDFSLKSDEQFSEGKLSSNVAEIVNAALQLIATVMPTQASLARDNNAVSSPPTLMLTRPDRFQFIISASIRSVTKLHVAEIIREDGPSVRT